MASSGVAYYSAAVPPISPSLPPRCLSTQVRPLLFSSGFPSIVVAITDSQWIPMTRQKCTSQPWASCLLDFLPAEVLDAPTCVAYRQLQFLQAIAPPNGALQDVCQSLSHRYRLSNLYCCDSQICRVDNLVGSGRHRECLALPFIHQMLTALVLSANVNWRTTPCQE